MRIIGNDGRCEAVQARVHNGELIVEQGQDIILIPVSIAGTLLRGLASAIRAGRRGAQHQRGQHCRESKDDIRQETSEGDSNET